MFLFTGISVTVPRILDTEVAGQEGILVIISPPYDYMEHPILP
jgi:hypothetical protein